MNKNIIEILLFIFAVIFITQFIYNMGFDDGYHTSKPDIINAIPNCKTYTFWEKGLNVSQTVKLYNSGLGQYSFDGEKDVTE